MKIKDYISDIDPHIIDQLLYHPHSVYGKWVTGQVRQEYLQYIDVENLDAVWQGLIDQGYIDSEGNIQDAFYQVEDFSHMKFSLELPESVRKAIFEEIDGSSIEFLNAAGEETRGSIYHVRVVNNIVNGPAKGGIRWVTAGDLMTSEEFAEAFSDLNKFNPTLDQVQDFIGKWLTQESMSLALGMTLKTSGMGIPLGGGKGAVFIGKIEQDENGKYTLRDYDDFKIADLNSKHSFFKASQTNRAKIARRHARDLTRRHKVGLDIDIPAPDMRTGDGLTIAWYEDEYLRYLIEEGEKGEVYQEDPLLFRQLKNVMDALGDEYDITATPLVEAAYRYWIKHKKPVKWLGVFTGKPAELGGALGRAASTGEGVVDVIERHFLVSGSSIDGKVIAIQGFGMVGKYTALRAVQRGARVIAINDIGATLIKKSGWTEEDLQYLIDHEISPTNKSWREGLFSSEGVQAITIDREKLKQTLATYLTGDQLNNLDELTDEIIDRQDDATGVIRDVLGDVENLPQMAKAIETAKNQELNKVTEAVLSADANVFVSAVGEGVLHEENAEFIKAPVVVEGGNGSFTPTGERIYLNKSNEAITYEILSDTLSNRKGVYSSYRETAQVAGARPFTEEENQVSGKAYMFEAYDRARAERTQGSETVSFRLAEDISAVKALAVKNYQELLYQFQGRFFDIRKYFAKQGLESKAKIATFIKRFQSSGLDSEIDASLLNLFEEMKPDLKKYLEQTLSEENFDGTSSDNFFKWLRTNLIEGDPAEGYIDFMTFIAALENRSEQEEAEHFGYLAVEDAQEHRSRLAEKIQSADIEITDNFRDDLVALILKQNMGAPDEAMIAKNILPDVDDFGGIDFNNITLDRRGNRINIQYDLETFKPFLETGIDGIAPVIINFVPIVNPALSK